MAKRLSVVRATKGAISRDERDRKLFTTDSFQNFALKLGMGTDNALSGSSYGYHPITRIRQLLEWIHRGSWLGGVAIDLVADDMVREGIEIVSTMAPEDVNALQKTLVVNGVWSSIADTIKWARLYGGAIAVMLIDGQDPKTPLNPDKIGPGQFKGLLVLDRWLVEPSLNDLVTDMGAELGRPKFYKVISTGQGLPAITAHHTRCLRLEGIRLPYQQRLAENGWGLSVLERLYDRMVAFDSATMGAAQLVHKSYLRIMKIKDMRGIAARAGPAFEGLTRYMELVRFYQGIEGVTLIDAEDSMEILQSGALAGIAEALQQFGQQLSGALQIPLVRLFGQSPGGLNSSGDSDLRTYYDGINNTQERDLRLPVEKILRVAAKSEEIDIPDDFTFNFRPLWQMTEKERADTAKVSSEAIGDVFDRGLISQRTAMKELREMGRETGIFTNITDEEIDEADEKLPELPDPNQMAEDLGVAPGAVPTPGAAGGGTAGGAAKPAAKPKVKPAAKPKKKTGDDDGSDEPVQLPILRAVK